MKRGKLLIKLAKYLETNLDQCKHDSYVNADAILNMLEVQGAYVGSTDCADIHLMDLLMQLKSD